MQNCTSLCYLAFAGHVVAFAFHIFTNVVQLVGWAEGNFILLTGTGWLVLISLMNMGLVLKHEDYVGLDSWQRSVPWGLSLLPVVYWWIAAVIEVAKVFSSGSWMDSVEEIFLAYIIWINIPLSAASTMYILLLPLLTDDLSPTGVEGVVSDVYF